MAKLLEGVGHTGCCHNIALGKPMALACLLSRSWQTVWVVVTILLHPGYLVFMAVLDYHVGCGRRDSWIEIKLIKNRIEIMIFSTKNHDSNRLICSTVFSF